MAKMYIDEVNEAKHIYNNNSFNNDVESANSIKMQLNDFINKSSTILKGEAWDAVREKMSEFHGVFNKQSILIDDFGKSIERAINMIYDCIGNESESEFIDTNLLNVYKEEKIKLQNIVEKLTQGEQRFVGYYDENKTQPRYEKIIDQVQINTLNNKIGELTKKIDKIEEFKIVYENALNMINDAYSKVCAFGNEINGITPSQKVTFGGYMM